MKILDAITKLFHIAACVAIIMFCGSAIKNMEFATDMLEWHGKLTQMEKGIIPND